MIDPITNLIIHLFGLDFAKARRIALIALAVGGVVIILFFGWWINSCQNSRTEKKIDEIKQNITESEVIANVKANEKANIEIQVKEHETNKNIAVNNFNNSVRRDSNTFTGNAGKRFCERFPLDSTCQ